MLTRFSSGLVEMGLLVPFLVFSLLLPTVVFPLREIPSSCSAHGAHHHINSSGLHLTLHHVRSPCSPLSPPDLLFSETFRHDELRVEALNSRLTAAGKKTAKPSRSASLAAGVGLPDKAVGVPLSPGLSLGVGNFVTKIRLGTPAREYVMVVDTGSSLTWVQCQPCKVSCHPQYGPLFDPTASATYHTVPCSSPECGSLEVATLNPSACSASKVCIYQASYGDSSFSVGYLSRDTLSLGAAALAGFVYGCGQDNNGLFGRTAGLIGLARNKLSMLGQLAPKYGYTFSYCLPTAAASSGYLSIGGGYNPSAFAFTPLVSSSVDASLYFIRLAGINVGWRAISVSASAYTSTPTIIDSGTVITRLPPAVYDALSEAVVAALAGHPRAPAFSILDTCFRGAGRTLPVPEVRLVFAGGAELRLAAKNVFYDVSESTTCLAFARAGGVAIIGNHQQQTFRVVYDVARSKVGFAGSGCG